MLTRVELKENAKKSLKDVWGESVKILLIYFGIAILTGFFSGFMCGLGNFKSSNLRNLLGIIIDSLIAFGLMSFFLKISRNETVTYKELFSKTNMFFKYLLAAFLMGIIVMIGTFLLIIPGVIAALALSQTLYILLDNPEMSVIDAMVKSNDLMKGHKLDLFVLGLSFIGWIFVGIISLGIGFLWLTPYMAVTISNFYNNLIEVNEKRA